jgi:hypothetical protein
MPQPFWLIEAVLERGGSISLHPEQLHALAWQVHYGKQGQTDGRDLQQQMSRASCLVLILAAIIYWQILQIDGVLRHWDPVVHKKQLVRSNNSNSPLHQKLHTNYYPPSGLNSALQSPILNENGDG